MWKTKSAPSADWKTHHGDLATFQATWLFGYATRLLVDNTEMEVRRRRKNSASWRRSNKSTHVLPNSKPTRPYYYSTYESEDETPGPSRDKRRIVILGGGPNGSDRESNSIIAAVRHRSRSANLGIEAVMINSNPETVSTDYDTSDLLFFEPLTTEDVLNAGIV